MTSSPPLVSIVIPAYNHQRFLREAIDSVLNQSYPAVELIVLNDGSTDDTESVLHSYPEGQFFWETQPNRGQSATLNRGWAMSHGDILSYLSADDVLNTQAVSRAVQHLLDQPATAAVYSDFMLISEASRVLRQIRAPEFSYYDLLVKAICQPGPGAFFRKKAYEQAGGWDVSLRQMPDLDFWLRIGLAGEIRRIPEVLSGFRVHDDSQTFAPPPLDRCDEPIRIVERCFERQDLPPEIRTLRSVAASNARLLSAAMHWRGGRYWMSFSRIAEAGRVSPLSLLRPHAGRLMLHSLLSRVRHHVQSWLARSRRFSTESRYICVAEPKVEGPTGS